MQNTQQVKIRKLVMGAMLSAITVLLTFTPIGMIPLPPPLLAVTMVHIPVLVAVLSEGLWVGVITGVTFGVCSFIRAWELGSVSLTLFFRNPLVSIVPRICIPFLAFFVFWAWKRCVKQTPVMDKVGIILSAVLGSIANTVLCLGVLFLIYGKDLTELINQMILSGNAQASYQNEAGAWLVSIVGLPNGIAEAVVSAILVPMIVMAVQKITKTKKDRGATR